MKLVRRSKRDGVSRLMMQEGVSSKGMHYGELAMVRELDTAFLVIKITLRFFHTRLPARIVRRQPAYGSEPSNGSMVHGGRW